MPLSDLEGEEKKYYKIRDVAEMLDLPQSTLRYWESEFPELTPMRSKSNIRYYSADNLRTLQIIRFLVKDRGLKIEAAKRELATNRRNLSRRMKIVANLREIRDDLKSMLAALEKRRDL